jgi:hypothetical protein
MGRSRMQTPPQGGRWQLAEQGMIVGCETRCPAFLFTTVPGSRPHPAVGTGTRSPVLFDIEPVCEG